MDDEYLTSGSVFTVGDNIHYFVQMREMERS